MDQLREERVRIAVVLVEEAAIRLMRVVAIGVDIQMSEFIVEPKRLTGVNGHDPSGVTAVESFRGRFAPRSLE